MLPLNKEGKRELNGGGVKARQFEVGVMVLNQMALIFW